MLDCNRGVEIKELRHIRESRKCSCSSVILTNDVMSSQAQTPEISKHEKLPRELSPEIVENADRQSQDVLEATQAPPEWVKGWRVGAIISGYFCVLNEEATKYLTAIRMCLSLFMTQADSTIASTAILAITNDLGGYERSSWVFTAYLLTYSGLPIIAARFSDIYGRKGVMVTSLIIFTIFSGGCGASQTLTQLYVNGEFIPNLG